MKKLLLFTILTFVLASGTQAVAEEKAEKPDGKVKVAVAEKKIVKSKDKVKVKCKDVNKAEICTIQNQKECQKSCYKIKRYKKMISQLKEIRDIAAKENASLTLKALDDLIAKKQKKLDKKIDKLSKGKGYPFGCTKSRCAVKTKSEAGLKLKDVKSCPLGCTKPCCAVKTKAEASPKTESKETKQDN